MNLYSSAFAVVVGRGLGMGSAFAFTVYLAHQFGSDRGTDLAFNALILPNAMIVIVGSIVPPVFLSVFKSVKASSGEREALAYARSGMRVVALAALVTCGAAVLAGPWLARAVGGGFPQDDLARFTRFLQAAFLAFIFASVAAGLKGFLNAGGSFFIPSLDTFVANSVAIGVIAAAAPAWGVFSVVAGAVMGALAKVLLMAPGYLVSSRGVGGRLLHPAVGETARLLVPVLLNSLVYLISIAIIRALAARIPGEGAISALSYSERLVAAPGDLFIASLGTILLASLSHKASEGDLEGVRRQMAIGLRLAAWFGIPAATGLTLLAEPIVALLYQHGQFDAADTAETARTLRASAFLLAFSGVNLLAQGFYALRATRLILVSGVIMAAINSGLGLALVGSWRQTGLAFAWAVSCTLGFFINLFLFARRAGWPDPVGLVSGLIRTCLATGLMAAVVWAMRRWTGAHVLLEISAGIVTFTLASRFLCPQEWGFVSRLWAGSR